VHVDVVAAQPPAVAPVAAARASSARKKSMGLRAQTSTVFLTRARSALCALFALQQKRAPPPLTAGRSLFFFDSFPFARAHAAAAATRAQAIRILLAYAH
jgi:hypothetical protein